MKEVNSPYILSPGKDYNFCKMLGILAI